MSVDEVNTLSAAQVRNTVLDLYHQIHAQLRAEIGDLDAAALNWVPAPDTNSIGTLVTHVCGSEAEVLNSVHGWAIDRDRAAEFTGTAHDQAGLLARLDAADAALERLGRSLTAGDLTALRTRPAHDAPQTGLYWLLRNYSHTREHLGHVQLTKQWYAVRQPGPAPA